MQRGHVWSWHIQYFFKVITLYTENGSWPTHGTGEARRWAGNGTAKNAKELLLYWTILHVPTFGTNTGSNLIFMCDPVSNKSLDADSIARVRV